MVKRKKRLMVLACALAAGMLVVPSPVQACALFDWMFGWCGGGSQTTFRPFTPTQTVRYVPQTSYRTVYRPVPVTTYRPVTTWSYQARRVPYTTYRMTYSNPYGIFSPFAASGYSTSGYSTPGSTCATCNGAATIGTTPAYSTPGTYPGGAPTMAPGDADRTPSLNGTGQSPQTFQQPAGQSPATETMKPIPDNNTSIKPAEPRLTPPDNATTLLPARYATHFQLIASPKAGTATSYRDGIDGWRASRR